MNLRDERDPGQDVERRKLLLLQDVRTVDWNRQVPAFHLNTKLGHLVNDGCLGVPGWLENCEKLVACLPSITVLCGWRGAEVDPFRGAREAFPSNRDGSVGDIVRHVANMWDMASKNDSTSHTGLYHGNIIEILEMSGVVSPGEARKFYLNVVGMSKTPEDSIEDLLDSCEGESLLGAGEKLELEGAGAFYRMKGGRGVLWEESESGTYLSMEGHGCICRWRVLHENGQTGVIQVSDAVHTSVTNLAEEVRDACRKKFGDNTKCYEFYEPRSGESMSMPCEITGKEGEVAGWIPVTTDSLPQLESWLKSR